MDNCSYCDSPIQECIDRLRRLHTDKDNLISALIRHGYHGEVSRGIVKLDNQPKGFRIKKRNRTNNYPHLITTNLSQQDYDKVMRIASKFNIKRTVALRKIVMLFKEEEIY